MISKLLYHVIVVPAEVVEWQTRKLEGLVGGSPV